MKLTGTDYGGYDEASVQAVLRVFSFLTPPIRPPAAVLAEFRKHFAAAADQPILILGATPELVDMANELRCPRIVSLDWNVDTFEAMRRLAVSDWGRVEFRHGDWTVAVPELAEQFGCVACDGGPLFLRFPDQWRALARAAFGYLRRGGTWVSRTIDWPEGEPPFASCVRDEIDGFAARRTLLDEAAAIAAFKTTTLRIRVRSLHRVVNADYLIDHAELARRNDWAAQLLFERFPEPHFRDVTDMNLLRLVRPTPDRFDLLSIVPPEPARRLLEDTGFDARVTELRTVDPGCDYVLVGTKG